MRFPNPAFTCAFAVVLLFAVYAQAAGKESVTLKLESPSFAANGRIPAAYTCDGNDVSPPLTWTGVPQGARSLALIVDDPDAPDPAAPKKTWIHWVIYNIPATATGLGEGVNPLPEGTGQGLNDWSSTDYRGPCPPVGRHRYFFKLYALNTIFAPQHPLTKEELEKSMIGYTISEATLIGSYEHPKR